MRPCTLVAFSPLSVALGDRATAFVTNDHRLRSIPRLDVLYLDDLVA